MNNKYQLYFSSILSEFIHQTPLCSIEMKPLSEDHLITGFKSNQSPFVTFGMQTIIAKDYGIACHWLKHTVHTSDGPHLGEHSSRRGGGGVNSKVCVCVHLCMYLLSLMDIILCVFVLDLQTLHANDDERKLYFSALMM